MILENPVVAAAFIRTTEVIGLESQSPAPIAQPKSAGPEWSADFIAPPRHLSLDGNTHPDDHRQEVVINAAKQRPEAGVDAVIINHPDIHREQLLGTVAAVPRPGVWKASIRKVANSVRSSQLEAYESTVGLVEMKNMDQTAQAVVRLPGKPFQRMRIPISQELTSSGGSE